MISSKDFNLIFYIYKQMTLNTTIEVIVKINI